MWVVSVLCGLRGGCSLMCGLHSLVGASQRVVYRTGCL